VEKNFYLEKILELKNNFSVKIISGVRGVGKTFLLKTFAEKLRADGVDENEIIFIDCAANDRPKNFQQLYNFVMAKTSESEKFFLLIDDIDCVYECEKAINAIFVGAPAEIYVTCSSATLAGKISALLPKNCDVLKIYPPSFSEHAKKFPPENLSDTLKNYLRCGSLIDTLGAGEKFIPAILRGAAHEIIFEIVEKNSLQNAKLFRRLMMIFAQNVGKQINPHQLLKILAYNGCSTNSNSIQVYSEIGAQLFIKLPRLDVRTGKIMPVGGKFYCVDNGIIVGLAEVDEKFLAENAVCVELWRRGYNVSYGQAGMMTITFVAKRGDEKIFIKVLPPNGSISVRRGTRSLRSLPAGTKKILITAKPAKNLGDIENITLQDFLSGK